MTHAAQAKPRGVAPLVPGTTVAGRYVVQRVIGQGGMGQVCEVEHVALGRRFALKVLRLERWNDELVRRFNREARALARLTTPRVAQVTDFGVDEGAGPFYVMELLEGETLEDRFQRVGPLPPREALTVCAEICDALTDVHAAGIVHRDLKPSNVGLTAAGPIGVKLLDFGLAAAMDEAFLSRITQSQQILGSLPYMAPEQFNGAEPTPRIDVYAIGVVLYEALTGRMPFMGPSTAVLIHMILSTPPPPLPPAIAALPGVEALIERLLAKEASARFGSAAEAARAIRQVCDALGGPLGRSDAPHPTTRVLGDASGTPAPAERGALGVMPTLMAEATPPPGARSPSEVPPPESGTRLSRSAPPPASPATEHPYRPTEPSPAYAPSAIHVAAPAPGYAPATPTYPMSAPSIQRALPPPSYAAVPAPAPTAPSSLGFRLAVVALVGVIFAGLSAIAVVAVLTVLDDDRAPAEVAAPAPASLQTDEPPPVEPPVEAAPIEPAPEAAFVEAPPAIEPAAATPVEVAPPAAEAPPRPEVRAPPPAPRHIERVREPEPEPLIPVIRSIAPSPPPSRPHSGDVVREW